MLTHRQLLHRQYLQSPVWAAKRAEAFTYHGRQCNRCPNEGDDVHHRTYARVGGQERMSDLEVLCRPCHKAHHVVERSASRRIGRSKKRTIHERALRAYLTDTQRESLKTEFNLTTSDLNMRIMNLERKVCRRAAAMVGCSKVYGSGKPKRR